MLAVLAGEPSAVPANPGALIVDTNESATIHALRLGWNKVKKGEEPFVAAKVPPGEHRLTFCNEYKCIDYRATIRPGRVLALQVEFDPVEVADVSLQHREKMQRWQTDCRGNNELESCKKACEIGTLLSPRRPTKDCVVLAKLEKSDRLIHETPGGSTETVVAPAPPGVTPVEYSPPPPRP
jgi:hypothetical protein